MKKRQLGNLVVSEIGMGCMGFSHGYGEIPEESYSIEAIQKAYAFGCTFFDTAEVYSPNLEGIGHNEIIVGKALKHVREHVVYATKLFLNTEEVKQFDVYETLLKHLKASMERMQTDYIDLYYLHHVNPDVPVEEVAEGMGKLIHEGYMKAWGLSNVGVKTLDRAHKVTPVAAVQNLYSMVERESEESVIPYCIEHNIGFVPFSPIASGLLSGKVTTNTQYAKVDDVRNVVPQLSKENVKANQPIIDMLQTFAQSKNATPAQISLAWMLHKYPNVVPIPGSKNQQRILENLGACNVCLTSEEYKALEDALNACEIHGHRGGLETD